MYVAGRKAQLGAGPHPRAGQIGLSMMHLTCLWIVKVWETQTVRAILGKDVAPPSRCTFCLVLRFTDWSDNPKLRN
eukprot:1422415-Amphidinium_carterae.1